MPISRTATAAPARALVLFDIDGTLIRRAGPHHREALSEAIRRVARLETTTDGIPVQGMLDRDILAIMMRRAGASEALIRRSMPQLVETAQAVYARTCPKLERKVCPGARALLVKLRRRGVPVGLVTGNLSRIAWKKMEQAGLRRYFRFGVFSEEARDRSGLVRIAVRRARREGWIDASSRISLIGDHPNDVLAAQANRIRSVAVATGMATADELAGAEPDVLVTDLRALQLNALLA